MLWTKYQCQLFPANGKSPQKKKKEIQFIGQPTYLLSYKQGSQAVGQFPKKLASLWAHQAVIPLARQPTCLTSDKSFPSSIVSPGNNNNNNKTKKLKKKKVKKSYFLENVFWWKNCDQVKSQFSLRCSSRLHCLRPGIITKHCGCQKGGTHWK